MGTSQPGEPEDLLAQVVEPVRRYLARRCDPDTAEDVLAEVLLVCWRRREEIPEPALPWAYGVAKLALANAQRSRRRRDRLHHRLAGLPQPVSEPPEIPDPALTAALASLRPADAEILRWWAWEDLSPTQIAELLSISPNAAQVRLHRAKVRLRAELGKDSSRPGHGVAHDGSRA